MSHEDWAAPGLPQPDRLDEGGVRGRHGRTATRRARAARRPSPHARRPVWRTPTGGPFGGGRGRRRRGDVRTALLLLLAEEPRNGYQLMQAIEERSGGRWRPSPGSVYPSLAQLEDEGLIRGVDRDGTKLFEVTDAGREHPAERDDAAPPWAEDDEAEDSIGDIARRSSVQIAGMQVVHAGDERRWRGPARRSPRPVDRFTGSSRRRRMTDRTIA